MTFAPWQNPERDYDEADRTLTQPSGDPNPATCAAIREGLRLGHALQVERARQHAAEVAVALVRLREARKAAEAAEDEMGAREWAKSRTAERWGAA